MDMVGRTADTNDLASCLVHQLAYVAVDTFYVCIFYLWTDRLYVEDDVEVYFTE